MADTFFEDATHKTALDGDEAVPATSDPTGTPADVYFTPDDLKNYLSGEYTISVTVSANDLIVALKDKDGNDPSASSPVVVKIGSTRRAVTAPLSVTLADATSWMGLGGAMFATLEQDQFAYLGYNTTDGVVIGTSRIPFANKYSDFSTTNTDEDYCAISTITNAAATDPYVVVGRFAATLSAAGTSHVWTVPTFTPENLIQRPIFNTRILSFVPQFTNLTLGSGALQARYMVDGRKCSWNFGMVWAADTSIGGAVSFTIPFTRSNFYSGTANISNTLAKFTDATGGGTGNYAGVCQIAENGASANLLCQTASGTYLYLTSLSSTVPFTWTTSDEIVVDNAQYFIE